MIEKSTIVGVTGGTGFIGRHLLGRLTGSGARVRAISRHDQPSSPAVEWVKGDLMDPQSVSAFVPPAGIVVNLAFLPDTHLDDHVETARTLAEACVARNVRHLIHCSTAVVAGNTPSNVVDESTPCRPRRGYEQFKYAIEEELRARTAGRIKMTTLRPTAVVGEGGRNLATLVDSLARQSRLTNYLRSSVNGRRAMNLVPVENVVEAIEVVANGYEAPGDVLLVSADEDARNEFQSVERLIMQAIGHAEYSLPRLPVPSLILDTLLRLKTGNSAPSRRRYISRYDDWRSRTQNADLGDAIQRFAASRVGKEDR